VRRVLGAMAMASMSLLDLPSLQDWPFLVKMPFQTFGVQLGHPKYLQGR
jgi:hypothetical protein